MELEQLIEEAVERKKIQQLKKQEYEAEQRTKTAQEIKERALDVFGEEFLNAVGMQYFDDSIGIPITERSSYRLWPSELGGFTSNRITDHFHTGTYQECLLNQKKLDNLLLDYAKFREKVLSHKTATERSKKSSIFNWCTWMLNR